MDWPSENDFNLLSEENSDFDVLLSPASVKSDEDEEVFVGPVGHMEKCIATGIDLNCKEEKSVESTETLKWSPLNTDKFVEVFREASLLARRYENHAEEKTKEMGGKIMQNKLVEQFIEESKLNLSLLKDITNSCSPRKMTSIIRSTPLKLHLPGIWNKPEDNSQDCLGIPLKSLKKAAVQATSCSMQSQQNSGDSSSLNNKEIAACSETTNFGEAPIDQPPICEPTQPMTSEKLCPHKPPESKASSSMRKSGAGSAGRPLNCISSSTSSLRTSPSVGRLLSQNMPLNTSKLKAPKNSRIAVPKSKISNSTCVTNAPNTKLMKPANISKLSTPGKVNLQGPGMQTVSNKGLQTIGSTTSKKVDIPVKSIKAGNVPGQDQRSKAKPFLQASQKSNVPSPGNTRSKTTDLKKQSACSAFESGIVASTPDKTLARGILQTPNVPNRRVSMTPGTRLLSGLPTPLNRRLSSIPAFTPRTQPRPGSLSRQFTSNRNRSMSASGAVLASSKRKPSEKPKVLCSPNSSGDEIFPPLVPCILDFSPDKPQTTCQEKAKEHASETLIKENLLFEINTKNRLIEDRPLIDLSNTPDQKRIAPLKDLEPLIDFSSPLILLRPADKENVDVNSPLLKF
ncbi:G2 and S phase-expressed protein 1 isoform X2 [Pristis pectinata]|uniref:G2 and S phase-expressed protein 1 isoform X2 n=1 Tax=Pristis pectinata TaxID=685728 RepID=UPI00223C93CB|nr:G2 and S phase-expressed protein 1 isoform X2 [Pristis pectinata]